MSAVDPAAPSADPATTSPARRGVNTLGVPLPLVQAGMGGIAGPRLAAAVAQAGALGTVALYKSDKQQTIDMVRRTATLTVCTFGVNVIPEVAGSLLEEQITAMLAAADRPLVLNSFGLLDGTLARRVRAAGHRILTQVGSSTDARRAIEAGTDVVALQGTEAGGHHLGRQRVRDLLAEVLALGTGYPLLAAGGIHDRDGVAELLSAGAYACLCGTAFVLASESDAHPDYQAALVAAGPGDTVVTDRFRIGWPGRSHRVLRNDITEAPCPPSGRFIAWTTVMGRRAPVPAGSAAAPTTHATGQIDAMARYAGTGTGRLGPVRPAAEIVAGLAPLTPSATGAVRADDRVPHSARRA